MKNQIDPYFIKRTH